MFLVTFCVLLAQTGLTKEIQIKVQTLTGDTSVLDLEHDSTAQQVRLQFYQHNRVFAKF